MTNLQHAIEKHTKKAETELARLRDLLDHTLKNLAREFSKPGGPHWESSSEELKWRELRTKIFCKELELLTLQELADISQAEEKKP